MFNYLWALFYSCLIYISGISIKIPLILSSFKFHFYIRKKRIKIMSNRQIVYWRFDPKPVKRVINSNAWNEDDVLQGFELKNKIFFINNENF